MNIGELSYLILNSSYLTNMKTYNTQNEPNFFSPTSSIKFDTHILSDESMERSFVLNRSRYGMMGMINEEDKKKLGDYEFGKDYLGRGEGWENQDLEDFNERDDQEREEERLNALGEKRVFEKMDVATLKLRLTDKEWAEKLARELVE